MIFQKYSLLQFTVMLRSGQGILYEIVQMAQLDGYKTGGTIHIVINNKLVLQQIDARSSTYCTDVAKVTLSPVLHVNADDAEAVVHAMICIGFQNAICT
jgi:2-oxoglutarate dehydrogenase E1 component